MPGTTDQIAIRNYFNTILGITDDPSISFAELQRRAYRVYDGSAGSGTTINNPVTAAPDAASGSKGVLKFSGDFDPATSTADAPRILRYAQVQAAANETFITLTPSAGGVTFDVVGSVSRLYRFVSSTLLTINPGAIPAGSATGIGVIFNYVQGPTGGGTLAVTGCLNTVDQPDTTADSVTQYTMWYGDNAVTVYKTPHSRPGKSFTQKDVEFMLAPVVYWSQDGATGNMYDWSGNGRVLTPYGTGDGIQRAGASMIPADGTGKRSTLNQGTTTTGVTAASSTSTFTTLAAHGLVAGDQISFDTGTITGGAGLAANAAYTVLATGLTATQFKLTRPYGGTALTLTTDMTAGTYRKVGLLYATGSWINQYINFNTDWTIAMVVTLPQSAATWQEVMLALSGSSQSATTDTSQLRISTANSNAPWGAGGVDWIAASGATSKAGFTSTLIARDNTKKMIVVTYNGTTTKSLKYYSATGSQTVPDQNGSATVVPGADTFTADRINLGGRMAVGPNVPQQMAQATFGPVLIDGAAWDSSKVNAWWNRVK